MLVEVSLKRQVDWSVGAPEWPGSRDELDVVLDEPGAPILPLEGEALVVLYQDREDVRFVLCC